MRIEQTMRSALEGGPDDSFVRERRAFHDLLNIFRAVPDLSWVEQWATAFVVEEIKRGDPEGWERTVGALRDELQAVHAQEGIPGITWRFAREVQDRYDAFLVRCLAEEQDPTRRENLEILQRGIQRDFPTRRDVYEAGRRVPMGSVILEHVPQWFPKAE
ncbi:MAG: hypothetical protein Q8R16_00170 [bacterium]|nr:hypothetical protein [bacterium]